MFFFFFYYLFGIKKKLNPVYIVLTQTAHNIAWGILIEVANR